MRLRFRLTALVGAAALAVGAGLAGAMTAETGETGAEHGDDTVCVAPTDAAAIDGVLRAAGSPLAGRGATFVHHAAAVGLDPRALVAIAKHETILATYAPAHRIKNPFGLGPHWEFTSYEDSIARAATVLRDGYLAEGRVTLAAISPKWAPIGAANDPTGLNQNWTAGVGGYYAALGGNPEQPALLSAQDPAPCGVGAAPAPTEVAAPKAAPAPAGPPVVVAWGGAAPEVDGPGPWDGTDPINRRPATIDGFVFPLAAPRSLAINYTDDYAAAGAPGCHGQPWRCAIDVDAGDGLPVVASIAGTLQIATASEQEGGIGFWIVAGRDRFGYAPLSSYAPGMTGGSAVAAGQHLGQHAGTLRIAWTRHGTSVNPHPLLTATRPGQAAPQAP